MTRKYFGTDGVRGRFGEGPITPEFVLKLGWAVGRVLAHGHKKSKVLIGKDTRISGYLLESALEAGLTAAGVNISLLGPMPTPSVAYLTRTLHAQAGIVISASHNPYHDNGIKFFSGDGFKLPDDVEQAIEEEIDKPLVTVDSADLGRAERLHAEGRYIEFCKSTIPHHTRLVGMKIVVDCANGASYNIAPYVFDELGAEVVAIGDGPNGFNINEEVGATHPEHLIKAVLEHKADLGVALDGDGDRLIMVDSDGSLLDGDQLLYIIARSRMRTGELKGAVVGTVMSNLGLEHAMREQGVVFERTQVGDRYIMERLNEKDWILGGEQSGHIICLDRTTTGDGIVSALQVLAEVRNSGKSLSELAAGMSKYPQKLVNVRLGEKSAADIMASDEVKMAVRQAELEMGDSGRVLLRPSGTEPLIRIMLEGVDEVQVDDLTGGIESVVKSLI